MLMSIMNVWFFVWKVKLTEYSISVSNPRKILLAGIYAVDGAIFGYGLTFLRWISILLLKKR